MQKIPSLLFLSVTLVVLAGCGGSSSGSGYVYIGTDTANPELRQFDIVDTDGTHSEFDSIEELEVSPLVNNGEFELFWDVYSDYDYFVDFRINTSPTVAGSQLVFSEYCDIHLTCHDYQSLYCEYQVDFDVACKDYKGDIQVANIGI